MKNYATIKKETSAGFGKKVYLLGKDCNGIKYWLEAPSWDCGWYWRFGYIATYHNNRRPEKAFGIDSHQHAVGDGFLGVHFQIDDNKSILSETTFTQDEAWLLAELFRQFYLMRSLADWQSRQSGLNVCDPGSKGVKINDVLKCNINKEILPELMKNITEILEPTEIKMEKIKDERISRANNKIKVEKWH